MRNSTLGGKWQTEERHVGQFPFLKGITHDIVVHAFEKSIAVSFLLYYKNMNAFSSMLMVYLT